MLKYRCNCRYNIKFPLKGNYLFKMSGYARKKEVNNND